jgi:hypothetical protein
MPWPQSEPHDPSEEFSWTEGQNPLVLQENVNGRSPWQSGLRLRSRRRSTVSSAWLIVRRQGKLSPSSVSMTQSIGDLA